MKHVLQVAWLACVLALVPRGGLLAATTGYRASSDSAAIEVPRPEHAPLLAVTQAGARLVAVGMRGMVIFSDDSGKSWTQAKVPVDSDLLAVSFSTPKQGWIVGHGGVVLQTSDGGANWTKQFAGQQLNELVVRHYKAQQPAAGSVAARTLKAAADAIESKSMPALLDVWFETPTTGTIVGTFNTLFRTEDGGRTWLPWMDHVENPDELHFYAVRGGTNGLYLAGEKGLVWRLDQARQRFEVLQTGYAGTLFGVVANGDRVLAYGMRGSVFLSEDAGKTWTAIATPRKVGITAGQLLVNGDIVLVDQAGGVLRSTDGGRVFAAVDVTPTMPLYGVSQSADGQLFMTGAGGVRVAPIR